MIPDGFSGDEFFSIAQGAKEFVKVKEAAETLSNAKQIHVREAISRIVQELKYARNIRKHQIENGNPFSIKIDNLDCQYEVLTQALKQKRMLPGYGSCMLLEPDLVKKREIQEVLSDFCSKRRRKFEINGDAFRRCGKMVEKALHRVTIRLSKFKLMDMETIFQELVILTPDFRLLSQGMPPEITEKISSLLVVAEGHIHSNFDVHFKSKNKSRRKPRSTLTITGRRDPESW